jgi:hypothetical protein
MRRSRRFGVAIGGVCLGVALVGLFWPGDRPAQAPESGLARAVSPGLDAASRRGEALDERVAALHRKVALKGVVLDDVLAGRETLSGAVARFREIEAEFPDQAEKFRQYLARQYPGCDFEECLVRNIIAHLQSRLRTAAERAAPLSSAPAPIHFPQ